MQAYILLNCAPGLERETIVELKKISEVEEVNGIMGRYDVIVKIASSEPDGIDKVVRKIRVIKHVTASYTMPVLYGQGGSIDS
ncbi:MAG TPA: Lrp/AsnC ligand binding domain-containing protein [Nitrosopumilaceae archaeon]|nr:Lrp/AsnC ligand binding domain-containing protein [Nitrosopumilaceae archaeon]